MGGGGVGAPAAQTNPNSFAGSRAAVAAQPTDFSSWLASIPDWAETPAAPVSASPLESNPVANPNVTAQGFTPTPTVPNTAVATPSFDPNVTAAAFTGPVHKPSSAGPVGALPPPPPPPADAVQKLTKPYDPVFKTLPTRMSGDTNAELMFQIVQNGQVQRPGETLPEEGYALLGPYEQRVRDYEKWYKQSGGK